MKFFSTILIYDARFFVAYYMLWRADFSTLNVGRHKGEEQAESVNFAEVEWLECDWGRLH